MVYTETCQMILVLHIQITNLDPNMVISSIGIVPHMFSSLHQSGSQDGDYSDLTCSSKDTALGCTFSSRKCEAVFDTSLDNVTSVLHTSVRRGLDTDRLTFSLTTVTETKVKKNYVTK